MRTILSMVEKDLRRRLRNPLASLVLLAFPVIFAGILALTFGGGKGDRVPKVRLLIADRDGKFLSSLVVSAFTRPESAKYFDARKLDQGEDGRALLEKEEATAVLEIPAGFSAALLDGRPTSLALIKNPSQSILPEVAEQVTAVLADGLGSASRLLAEPLKALRPTLKDDGKGPADAQVATIAVSANQAITRASPYVLPPVITLESLTLEDKTADQGKPAAAKAAGTSPMGSIFLLVLPGISVFALFNLCDQAMRDLLVEGRLKTLRRQLAGPVGAGTVIAAKALGTAALGLAGLILLSIVGALTLPAGTDVHVAAFLLLALALILATTGFAAFVYGLARGEKQGSAFASAITLLMAFTGGSFIPLQSLPKGLRALSPFSLMYWASAGFNKVVGGAGTVRDVLPNLAVLAGAGALLLALSTRLWRRRLLGGDLA